MIIYSFSNHVIAVLFRLIAKLWKMKKWLQTPFQSAIAVGFVNVPERMIVMTALTVVSNENIDVLDTENFM